MKVNVPKCTRLKYVPVFSSKHNYPNHGAVISEKLDCIVERKSELVLEYCIDEGVQIR
jgi:hypothetical protein